MHGTQIEATIICSIPKKNGTPTILFDLVMQSADASITSKAILNCLNRHTRQQVKIKAKTP